MQESSIVKGIKRDLYWALHIAQFGTSPEQRAQGKRNAARFQEQLEQALAPATWNPETARQRVGGTFGS